MSDTTHFFGDGCDGEHGRARCGDCFHESCPGGERCGCRCHRLAEFAQRYPASQGEQG